MWRSLSVLLMQSTLTCSWPVYPPHVAKAKMAKSWGGRKEQESFHSNSFIHSFTPNPQCRISFQMTGCQEPNITSTIWIAGLKWGVRMTHLFISAHKFNRTKTHPPKRSLCRHISASTIRATHTRYGDGGRVMVIAYSRKSVLCTSPGIACVEKSHFCPKPPLVSVRTFSVENTKNSNVRTLGVSAGHEGSGLTICLSVKFLLSLSCDHLAQYTQLL